MYNFNEHLSKEIEKSLKRGKERQKLNGDKTYTTEEVIEHIKQLGIKAERENELYTR